MKIAVSDACIFIDLFELNLISFFLALPLEIHTSFDVFQDLHLHQQQFLQTYLSAGKLSIHILTMEDKLKILNTHYPKGLSEDDKTVLYLAEALNALVISGDKAVRLQAKKRAIEYHGMLWIFDQLLSSSAISRGDACLRLKKLIVTNPLYQINAQIVIEVDQRLKLWSGA